MDSAIAGAITVWAVVATWRWVHWKREAYRTRDAALRAFRRIEHTVRRPGGGLPPA